MGQAQKKRLSLPRGRALKNQRGLALSSLHGSKIQASYRSAVLVHAGSHHLRLPNSSSSSEVNEGIASEHPSHFYRQEARFHAPAVV
jgi:hypothetical protein